jgi:hypothetical protein
MAAEQSNVGCLVDPTEVTGGDERGTHGVTCAYVV